MTSTASERSSDTSRKIRSGVRVLMARSADGASPHSSVITMSGRSVRAMSVRIDFSSSTIRQNAAADPASVLEERSVDAPAAVPRGSLWTIIAAPPHLCVGILRAQGHRSYCPDVLKNDVTALIQPSIERAVSRTAYFKPEIRSVTQAFIERVLDTLKYAPCIQLGTVRVPDHVPRVYLPHRAA